MKKSNDVILNNKVQEGKVLSWNHPDLVNGLLRLHKVNIGTTGVVWRFEIASPVSALSSHNLTGHLKGDSQNHSEETESSQGGVSVSSVGEKLSLKELKNCSNMVLKVVKPNKHGQLFTPSDEIRAVLEDGGTSSLDKNLAQTGLLGFLKWQRFSPSFSDFSESETTLALSESGLSESRFQWMRKMDTSLEAWLITEPNFADNGKNFVTIASHTAMGILALQSHSRPIVHSDVKPANIMLNFESLNLNSHNADDTNLNPESKASKSTSTTPKTTADELKTVIDARHVDWDFSLFASNEPGQKARAGTSHYRNIFGIANGKLGEVDDTYALAITFAELYFRAIDAASSGKSEPLKLEASRPGFNFREIIRKENRALLLPVLEPHLNASSSSEVNAIGSLAYGILKMWDLKCFADMEEPDSHAESDASAEPGLLVAAKFLTLREMNECTETSYLNELRPSLDENIKAECKNLWRLSRSALKVLTTFVCDVNDQATNNQAETQGKEEKVTDPAVSTVYPAPVAAAVVPASATMIPSPGTVAPAAKTTSAPDHQMKSIRPRSFVSRGFHWMKRGQKTAGVVHRKQHQTKSARETTHRMKSARETKNIRETSFFRRYFSTLFPCSRRSSSNVSPL